jgi:transcriptional regulator with XRE-family HTH domain
LLAAHSIPANSSGDFKPVQLGDRVSPRPAVSDPQSPKARDESVLVERRATFSARLRAARESKGVSLQQIAASSKINVSLLKGLENGDVSRWPKGLYRRSYLRDYLRAVGLPVEPTVADFVRLFPDEEDRSVEIATPREEENKSPALSMTLDATESGRSAKARRHAVAAGLDAGIVLVASGAGAFWVQADFWVMLAFIALAYYSVGTAALGRSLGAYWVVDRNGRRWKTATSVPTDRDSLAERIRRLRKLSIPGSSGSLGDAARVPWNAILLRIWFLR